MRRLAAVVAALVALFAFAGAQAPRAGCVILVTIDGLRGDYLAPHDTEHTTPGPASPPAATASSGT